MVNSQKYQIIVHIVLFTKAQEKQNYNYIPEMQKERQQYHPDLAEQAGRPRECDMHIELVAFCAKYYASLGGGWGGGRREEQL